MLFSFENIHRQYLLCRRNKRNTRSALAFEFRQEENLLALQEELVSRAYRLGRSVCFFCEKPKLREIFAADFRDRIVHHILLTRVLVFHDCTRDPDLRGDPRLLERLPPHKTLFHALAGKGLPIGNLNSQFFANVYLNRLDQFVKHTLKCRFYLRYCDDFVLLSTSREQLRGWRDRIDEFLGRELLLALNSKRQRLAPMRCVIDFLGYIVRRDYLLVRRRVVGNLRSRLATCEKRLVAGGRGAIRYRFDRETLDGLAASLSSFLGHCKPADSFRLIRSLWRRYPFLGQYFSFDPRGWKLTRKFNTPRSFPNVRRQYGYFRFMFPGDALFFQVGRFFEFYRPDDARFAALLGLTPMEPNRRGARFGFPLRLFAQCRDRLLAHGVCVNVIREWPRCWDRIRERGLVARYAPVPALLPESGRSLTGNCANFRKSHPVAG